MTLVKRNLLTGDSLYTLFHQVMFLLTGLATTLGTQWIFYHGAATGDSYLTQLAQYVGMVLVGLLIPTLKKNKEKNYKRIPQEENDTIQMSFVNTEEDKESGFQEGPIEHTSVMKLAVLDVFANFCVTLGFSIIGSGMYQVIYSSVVIWCAILTFLLMNRKLATIQWVAIFGTSAGLAFSSLDSMNKKEGGGTLMFGTVMTMVGTFFYYYIMSKHNPPPLPARVCFYSGIYNVIISIVWIGVYTLPRWDSMVNILPETTFVSVTQMYLLVIISNALHAWNYYELIERTGSVATGILQGLRAVCIYLISNALYCKSDAAQCKLII
ncbi:hypothetical protein CU098_013151 [Rhizopus stolonifer]|uniref:EamA domain-containing protein n=1 Tax=Rhizopus stolonifer TaxID=4846 RepID=A0A367KRP9_RHIST|nr:hypothetical protein CU098_013151 [Rhizopus stolonifer]